MKVGNKSPIPVLSGVKLEFFYSILTLWESGEKNKVVKNFKSAEIKRFLARSGPRGVTILHFTTDKNKRRQDCKYELYVLDSKDNQGMSLLYHLRNAFAHNDIQLCNNGNDIFIHHTWGGTLKLKTTMSFKVLKELIETIRGQHNLTQQEKQKKYTHKQKSK